MPKPTALDSIAQATTSLDSLQNFYQFVVVQHDVKVKQYFTFIDSVLSEYPQIGTRSNAEYILVRNNPWLIDSLRNLDYYIQKSKGTFQYDQSEEIILHKNDTINIPTRVQADSLELCLSNTTIDVNIPEYKLRIIQHIDTVLTFKVRVGRNAEEYFESLGRVVNQRTPIGKGEIILAIREPIFVDLHTGEKYEETKRDDGRYTRMPVVPSLEPEIDKTRHGAMFHATTNIKTLGRAYSNGCVGLREADMWTLYYYAPPGTNVIMRYDLKVRGNHARELRDIYHLKDSLNKVTL